MKDQYKTNNLNCAAFLYANKASLVSHEKVGNVVMFDFEADFSLDDLIDNFFQNKPVPVLDYLSALKTLKTIVYKGVKP
jgi:hypothetical protein